MHQNDLISVEDLDVHFTAGRSNFASQQAVKVRAVDGLTLTIRRGETLGLVGESGCGKSTVGRAILNMQKPTGGRVVFDGNDLNVLSKRKMRQLRKRMQMVYQDPYASLNPRLKVRDIVGEPLDVHRLAKGAARTARIKELLEVVGLDETFMDRYPHQFSGGQRQRIGIARALAVEPDFIVLDESIAALDVSIQAQIINLLKKLQRERDITYLFISHDMAVIRHMSDRVAVMYLGEIVEIGPSEKIFANPLHPYTKALRKAVPIPKVEGGKKPVLEGIKGELPSPHEMPAGCRFCNRCPIAEERCKTDKPLLQIAADEHFVACHYA